MRAQLHSFDYSYDRAEAGNDYTDDLSLSSTALLADWHPGGPFRLTAGLVFNNNELAVEASSTFLELGRGRYDGDLRVQTTVDRLPRTPASAGVRGATSRASASTWISAYCSRGHPEVTAEGQARASGIGPCRLLVAADSTTTLTGSACTEAFADLRSDAMREHGELTDALEDFEIYPVAVIGLVSRF